MEHSLLSDVKLLFCRTAVQVGVYLEQQHVYFVCITGCVALAHSKMEFEKKFVGIQCLTLPKLWKSQLVSIERNYGTK